MEQIKGKVPLVCPVCSQKTTGMEKEDGMMLAVCHHCGATVVKKEYKRKILVQAIKAS